MGFVVLYLAFIFKFCELIVKCQGCSRQHLNACPNNDIFEVMCHFKSFIRFELSKHFLFCLNIIFIRLTHCFWPTNHVVPLKSVSIYEYQLCLIVIYVFVSFSYSAHAEQSSIKCFGRKYQRKATSAFRTNVKSSISVQLTTYIFYIKLWTSLFHFLPLLSRV